MECAIIAGATDTRVEIAPNLGGQIGDVGARLVDSTKSASAISPALIVATTVAALAVASSPVAAEVAARLHDEIVAARIAGVDRRLLVAVARCCTGCAACAACAADDELACRRASRARLVVVR